MGRFDRATRFRYFHCSQNKNPKLKKELSKILPTKWSGKAEADHNSEPLNGLICGTLKFKEFFTRLEQGD